MLQSIELAKGVNLNSIYIDKFKTSSIGIFIKRNLTPEEVSLNALLIRVLSNWNGKFNSIRKINTALENLNGAALNAQIIKKGDFQILQFYMEIINDDTILKNSFDFLQNLIFNPILKDNCFPENIVEIEKENLIKNILDDINNKRTFAKNKCIEIMFGKNGFGLYADGYIDNIKNITPFELFSHYKKVISEGIFDIFVVSNKNFDFIKNSVIEKFKFKDLSIKKIEPLKHNLTKNDTPIIENSDVNQAKLCVTVTFNNTSPTLKIPLLIGNEIFGGNSNSKLFINIREKESLCYYISSFLFKFKNFLLIESGIQSESFEKTYSLIKKHLESIKNGDFSQEDINNAISSVSKNFHSILDYNNLIMDFHYSEIIQGSNSSLLNLINCIDNVSKNDITDAFKDASINTIYMLKGND